MECGSKAPHRTAGNKRAPAKARRAFWESIGGVGLLLWICGPAGAMTYGLKSLAPGGTVPSVPPTHLYRFAEDGSSFVDLGAVKRGAADLDLDALGLSPSHGLLAYELAAGASQLVSINPATLQVTSIGPALTGRDVRGAVFDTSDRLWAADAANDQVFQVNPTTGAVLPGTVVGLALGGSPFNLSTACDVAVRGDGSFYVASSAGIYTLNPQTGGLTNIRSDTGQGLAGAAFSLAAGDDDLFAYEINGTDDIFRYDVDVLGVPRTTVFSNIIPSFNAGRGDLATIIIPEPLTALGALLGVAGLAGYVRKRRLA